MKRMLIATGLLLASGLAWAQTPSAPAAQPAPANPPDAIQAALDKNPGRMLYLPPGDYVITKKVVINKHNTGLFGPGRIIQSDPDQPILEIEHANNVQIRDITLTRAEGKMDAKASGLQAQDCRNLVLDNVQVIDNRAQPAAITVRDSASVQVRNCVVQNYMRIGIDDRTAGNDYGYAFNCIDGTGVGISGVTGCLLQNNRIIELNLLPTEEMKAKYELGKFVKKNPVKGTIISQATWDGNYAGNWHQGSGLVVSSPEESDYVQLLGNYIENAAQGMDIHADHVIIANNIVNNSFMGMKAMHGARNVQILGNQFSKNDLWSIGLMSGASSHAAGVPPRENVKPEEAKANVDGGHIVAHNIVSDFGYGHAHWMWGNEGNPLLFDAGQKPINPPVKDVIVLGNMVYDTGRDQVLVGGKPQLEPPRYKFAARISEGRPEIRGPVGIFFADNLLHPGTAGISNQAQPKR